jgi:hypothetical protein
MLTFDQYVNDNFLRRQRLSSCEHHRTNYNQVERSLRADLPDTSSFIIDVVAAQRTNLHKVSVSRAWKHAGRVQATFSTMERADPDSIEVRLWRDDRDRHPAQWNVPRAGPVGTKVFALGRRVLGITCRTVIGGVRGEAADQGATEPAGDVSAEGSGAPYPAEPLADGW